jgi:hypothetical protein
MGALPSGSVTIVRRGLDNRDHLVATTCSSDGKTTFRISQENNAA